MSDDDGIALQRHCLHCGHHVADDRTEDVWDYSTGLTRCPRCGLRATPMTVDEYTTLRVAQERR